MHDTIHLASTQRKSNGAKAVASTRKFSSIEPVIANVTDRICFEFEHGSLEVHLSRKYTTRRPFIEAVIRREFRRLRAENAELRQRRVAA